MNQEIKDLLIKEIALFKRKHNNDKANLESDLFLDTLSQELYKLFASKKIDLTKSKKWNVSTSGPLKDLIIGLNSLQEKGVEIHQIITYDDGTSQILYRK